MIAYKIWHDTKHYIHKDSTVETVKWTQNIQEAKLVIGWAKAYNFFFKELGFNPSQVYDKLHMV